MNSMKIYIYNLKKYSLLFVMLLIVLVIGFKSEKAYAAVNVSYDNLIYGKNDEKIGVKHIDKGFSISIENELEEEGYTPSYFSPSICEDLSRYGCISFHINNTSDGSLKLNFIINEDTDSFKLENNVNVLAVQDGDTVFEILQVKDGVFELKENFKGSIYIPFSVLGKENFKTINSWGITVVNENGNNKNFDITDFAYIEKSKCGNYGDLAQITIKGDREIPIPVIGEAIVDYKIGDSSSKVKFFLKDDYKGVYLSEDGHLSIDSTACEENINIYVEMENGQTFSFNTSLKERLTKSIYGVTNKSLSTPTLDETVNKDGLLINFLLNKYVIITLRIVFISIVVFVSIIYLYWRGYFKFFTKDKLKSEE